MSGGDITLEGVFTATTQGNQSSAVVLQSIGGGGGQGVLCLGLHRPGTNATGDTSAGEIVARSAGWNIQTLVPIAQVSHPSRSEGVVVWPTHRQISKPRRFS